MARALQTTLFPRPAHLGWASGRCRSQARPGPPPRRRALRAASAQRCAPRARHAPHGAYRPLPAGRPGLPGRSPCARCGLPRGLSDPPFQCARRPSPSHRRGRRHAGARPRPPGARHPRGAGAQPRPRPPRARLGRQVSRSGAHHAARGAPLPGLRIEEPLQALRGRTRARSLLVGDVLRRVAAAGRTRATGASRGPRADLARRDWLAAVRTARHRRTASPVLAAHVLCPESRWSLRQSVGVNRVVVRSCAR